MELTPERILYEDNHLIIVNKLAGEIVQGDKTGDRAMPDDIKEFIARRDRKPGNVFLGVTHRLDRPTSGAVIFAKTSKGLSRMNELFRKGGVDKIYWAVTENAPPRQEGTLTGWLFRDRRKNRSFCWREPGGGTSGSPPALPLSGLGRPLSPGRGGTADRQASSDPLPAGRFGLPHQGGPEIRGQTVQ